MGPGKSIRSHSADEFILVAEVEEGISIYTRMLERFLKPERFG
jgi:acetylornithine deacetylase